MTWSARLSSVSLLALGILAIGAAPAVAAPALSTGTNDFTITSFTADYYLDVDGGGRSTLHTVEVIEAQFPDFPQNHGILRHLVDDYQGHPTDLSVESVTDQSGRSWNYETESDGDFLTVKIGDADRYVEGAQTFVITYNQRNVTLFDGAVEDFYWDTNGTGWPQPFGSVVARVHVPDTLTDSLNGDASCYRGVQGSSDLCEVAQSDDEGGGVVYTVSGTDLRPYENLTVAIGFDQGTFVPRDNSIWASPYFFVELFFAALAVVAAVLALVRRFTVLADAPGRPTIVAEYLPPKGTNLLVSGALTKRTKRAVAAQLVSMAVRHNIRIIETEAEGFFASGNDYTIELLTPTGLDAEEIQLAQAFFGASLQPGTSYRMKKQDTTLSRAVYSLISTVRGSLIGRGLISRVPAGDRALPFLLAIAGVVGTFITMMLTLDDGRGGAVPLLVLLPAIVSVIIVFAVVGRSPLTAAGAELRDYLEGLLLYIRVAERDRIRILQSPEGAERTPVDTTDRGVMLELYERVLPYAILFDEEKRWAKELGDYYDQEPPTWYSGTTVFTTAAFVSSMSNLSTTTAAAYASASSSSSGSGGGGSSGGGGGGGGGGGW